MALQGEYLGMSVRVDATDQENFSFFSYCGQRELRVQQCTSCDLKRFPPTTACPFCSQPESTWECLSGRGTVYSYGEVHHAIQPAFASHTPYLLLLVELDEQRNEPHEFDGLRVQGNLATAEAELASPDLVRQVGIGTRVRVVFKDIGPGIAMPLWTIDEQATQPQSAWRYPLE
ncbi:MAG: hypothetical protein E2O58_13570 [Gammaproteobacteria bacterium]|nr:MAG: hypothetical protein E2O58_13570 [Gammaproteobacteria bacterium]